MGEQHDSRLFLSGQMFVARKNGAGGCGRQVASGDDGFPAVACVGIRDAFAALVDYRHGLAQDFFNFRQGTLHDDHPLAERRNPLVNLHVLEADFRIVRRGPCSRGREHPFLVDIVLAAEGGRRDEHGMVRVMGPQECRGVHRRIAEAVPPVQVGAVGFQLGQRLFHEPGPVAAIICQHTPVPSIFVLPDLAQIQHDAHRCGQMGGVGQVEKTA